MSKAPKRTVDSKLKAAVPVRPEVEGSGGSFEAILAQPSRATASNEKDTDVIHGVVIGTLSGVSASGKPEVRYPGSPSSNPLQALATQPFAAEDVGRELALSFVDGNPRQPVILGFLQQPGAVPFNRAESVDVDVDGETVTLTGKRQIVLKCGKASITLTRAGKVIIKGAYLTSRSTGVNRIKGGSVQIN